MSLQPGALENVRYMGIRENSPNAHHHKTAQQLLTQPPPPPPPPILSQGLCDACLPGFIIFQICAGSRDHFKLYQDFVLAIKSEIRDAD